MTRDEIREAAPMAINLTVVRVARRPLDPDAIPPSLVALADSVLASVAPAGFEVLADRDRGPGALCTRDPALAARLGWQDAYPHGTWVRAP